MVLKRAMSSLRLRILPMPSCLPRLLAKRIRKSCSAALASSLFNSSLLRLRILSSSMMTSLKIEKQKLCLVSLLGGHFRLHAGADDEGGLERQLVRRETHSFLRELDRNTFHLEQDLARANDGNPVIGSALTLTHTGFGRLLGDGLVREETQPDLTATLDKASHSDTRGLDLAVGDVTALQNLETEIAKRDVRAAPRLTAHAAALLLAVFNLLGQKHEEFLLTSARCCNETSANRSDGSAGVSALKVAAQTRGQNLLSLQE